MNAVSALYPGTVVHRRLRPKPHRLRYRVAPMLIDLDELPALDKRLRLFAHNRWGVFSFRDADHGNGQPGGLQAWVREKLAEAGIDHAGGRTELLCYPRMLGYVFNPLSVYFCRRADGRLSAILYEVHNTLHERHTYIIPAPEGRQNVVRQVCAKEFYVSPFMPMDCTYNFRIGPPGEGVLIAIDEHDSEGPLLSAIFAGKRKALSDGALLRTLFAFPLMTLKIMAGIHFEAVRLWLKRVPLVPYTKAEHPIASSVVTVPGVAEI